MKISAVIDDLKIELAKNFFDPLHDISHHYETWKNCFHMIDTGGLSLNKKELYIAAWAHDLETYYENNNEFEILKKILSKNSVPKKSVNLIFQIIEEHSFSKQQTIIESQVLFDADKLEHISIPRWEYTLQAHRDGYFTSERFQYYAELQNKLLTKVPKRLYFKYSQDLYKKRLVEWKKYAVKSGFLDSNGNVDPELILKTHL